MRGCMLVVLLGLVTHANAGCHYIHRRNMAGTGLHDDCEHPEYPEWKVQLGYNFLTPDCYNITCSPSTMSVCQFGWRLARLVGLPADCTKIRVGQCGVRFVKARDVSVLCFEDKSIEGNSLPGE